MRSSGRLFFESRPPTIVEVISLFVYVEFTSRRPGIPLAGFHEIVNRGQSGWQSENNEDLCILNVGRTWRLGPEPEYFTVWHVPASGLERLGEWEEIFRSGSAASLEEPFQAAARIDRAGCYDALVEPVPGAGGPYYAEYFEPAADATDQDIRELYERRRSSNGLVLNLLARRIGRLGPDPSGIAVWSVGSYDRLDSLVREPAQHPIAMVDAGVYADIGAEIL